MPFYPDAIETQNWRRDAQDIFKTHTQTQRVSARVRDIAQALVGRPYLANALHGGPAQAERLLLDLSGFDCVTLVENVIALARARDLAGYVAELLQLRYRGGQVAWLQRRHYFSDWMQGNARRRVLKIINSRGGLRYEKKLDALAAYPARLRKLSVCPRKKLLHCASQLGEASVVAFASTRAGVDFFHVGLLFWSGGGETQKLQLVHASRSAGGVVTEPLVAFLKRNRMRGLKVARILEF